MAKSMLFITHSTAAILGLDDGARYADVERQVCYPNSRTGGVQCFGDRQSLQDIVNEIYDRATEGDGGYDESARNKAILRRALARLKKRGWDPKV